MKEKKVRVFTSGSFDLFHIGHLNILEKSALLGDELIVGVSTDELIQHYKGMPPIIPFEQRMRIVSSIKCVTKVVKQVKLTEIAQLERENIKFRLNSGRNQYIANGGKLGRKEGSKKTKEQKAEQYKKVLSDLRAGKSIRDVAKLNKVSPSTVLSLKKEFGI